MTTKDTVIIEDGFGFAPGNVKGNLQSNRFKIVRRYTLTNKNGASVRLISWGAGIQSIRVPNNQGALGDIALGFDDIDGYMQNRCVGRITNRVAIGVKENSLYDNNDNVYIINNGFDGLDNVNWESYVLDKQVIFGSELISKVWGESNHQLFSESKKGDKWVQCLVCHRWELHENCTFSETTFFMCDE